MKKTEFGIIGCGYIANRHAQSINASNNAILRAVYNSGYEKAIKFARQYKTIATTSLNDFLNIPEIDLVTVCTPSGNHCETAIKCLEAGKNVLVEKPMALTSADCLKMIKAAEKSNKELFVVKQNRFNKPVEALKTLIEKKLLGNIYMVSVNCFWNRNKQYYSSSKWKGKKLLDGGTLYNQFSHFVDIIYYLFGEIENINGVMSNSIHQNLIEFEDSGAFTFELKKGGTGSFTFTTASSMQNMEGSITLFSENATIKIGGKYLNQIDYVKSSNTQIEEQINDIPVDEPGSNHQKMIENVIQALNKNESIMTNAHEGLKVVETIETIYRNLRWANSA
jgi:UDP-N-acetyl-2-amino-2-deoxyglucuronate dehydrogenase